MGKKKKEQEQDAVLKSRFLAILGAAANPEHGTSLRKT